MSPDADVELYFLPTEHGGKSIPTRSGYRPQFFHRGTEWGIQLDYPNDESVPPGGTARADLTFIFERPANLVEGMPFLLREGAKVVAYGCVRRILPAADPDSR